ncbi:MAG TPA: response regulator transcription factor [Gemmatimonadales bacterium]|nr:response regulator transcription factor [Gemmatimonadales bacterium]
MRVLIIEDNRNLVQGLRHNLELDGHRVEAAYTGEDGLRRARQAEVDLILLDLMIPKPDGWQILRTLREEGVDTPVVVLTARGQEEDKVRGLRLGADDYVTKPFGLMELLARLDAIRRRLRLGARARGSSTEPIEVGEIRIEPATRTVLRSGNAVALRPREFDLLLALARRAGEVVSRGELLREIWGYQADVMSRTVDTHVGQLRAKLEEDPAVPRWIVTVRKSGYRLRVAG